MKQTFRLAVVLAVSVAAISAAPMVTIFTAIAPNASGSPSYATWQANAVACIVAGLTSCGTPGTPTFFSETTSFVAADEDVTNLPSWLGMANPATPFNNELGNRITFIAVVHDASALVDITSGMSFLVTVPASSDYNTGGGVALSASRTTYSGFTVGVDVNGGNMVTNTQTSGSGAHNFILSFIGFGLEPFTMPENQAAINANIAAIQGNPGDKTLTDCTVFGGPQPCSNTNPASSMDTVTVADVGVPEPGTVSLLVFGLVGLGVIRRKLTR